MDALICARGTREAWNFPTIFRDDVVGSVSVFREFRALRVCPARMDSAGTRFPMARTGSERHEFGNGLSPLVDVQ